MDVVFEGTMSGPSSGHKDRRTQHPGDGGQRAPRVVVIGAGIAGVGAVGVLREGGITDVILLEAQGRPGGRVETCELENGFIEMGAQFLHGTNEVYDIAEREGMLVEQDPEEESQPDTPYQFAEFIFHTSDRQAVSPHVVKHNLQVLEDLQLGANRALREGRAGDINVSVGQFFRGQHPTARLHMKGSDPLKSAMLRWLEYWDCQDCGGTVDQLSLPGNGQYVFYPGNGTRETTQGLEAVFRVLLKENVPEGCLRLNKAVKAVHWTPGRPLDAFPQDLDITQLGNLEKKYGINNNLINGEDLQLLSKNSQEAAIRAQADRTKGKMAQAIINESGESAPTTLKVYEEEEEKEKRKTKQSTGNKHCPSSPNYLKDFDMDVGRTMRSEVVGGGSGVSTSGESSGRSNDDFAIRIQCEDGDVFYADHVIVTSSMGFLSANPEFFQPPLPLQHREAVTSMGFGNVAKMCLFWDREDFQEGCPPFPGAEGASSGWEQCILGSDVEGMIPLWLEGEHPTVSSAHYCQPLSNGNQWYEEICIYSATRSHDFCVIGWLGGEAATVMESLPESEVMAVLHELLVLFLGRPELPAPRRMIRTGWGSNPYMLGAYSFLATGVPLELHEVLSQPLPSAQSPVVQLAGEACSKRYYSTAHGALESGQDAARAILRHHNLA